MFGIVSWGIASRWPASRWRVGAIVFASAAMLAQGVEPVLEVLFYQGRIGYPDEPERWVAFGRSIAAAAVAYWGALWLCARPAPALRTG